MDVGMRSRSSNMVTLAIWHSDQIFKKSSQHNNCAKFEAINEILPICDKLEYGL